MELQEVEPIEILHSKYFSNCVKELFIDITDHSVHIYFHTNEMMVYDPSTEEEVTVHRGRCYDDYNFPFGFWNPDFITHLLKKNWVTSEMINYINQTIKKITK